MKRIIKIAFTYSSIEAFQKGIYFLILPILTYYIVPKEYGNISIILMIISIFQMFFTFSLESTIMRFYPKFKYNKMKKVFLGTIFYSSLVIILLWVLILMIFGPWIFRFLLPSVNFYPYIFLAILIVSFKMIILMYISFLKTIQDLKNFSIFYNVYFFLQTLLILFFVTKFHFQKDILYLFGMLLSQIIMFFVVFFKIKKNVCFTINTKILKFCLDYSFSIIPIKISNTINSSIDRYILFNFLGKGITGIYFFGWQIATIIQIIVMALNSAYLPNFFKNYEINKKNGKFDSIYKNLHIIVFLVLLFESIFLNGYQWIFTIISINYTQSKNVLPFFIFYFSMNIVYFINTNALSLSTALNRKKIYGIILGILLNVFISIFLIKFYGFIGVIIGTLIGQIVTIFYFIYLVSKYTSFKFASLFYMLFIFLIFICNYMIEKLNLKVMLTLIILTIYFLKVIYDTKKYKSS